MIHRPKRSRAHGPSGDARPIAYTSNRPNAQTAAKLTTAIHTLIVNSSGRRTDSGAESTNDVIENVAHPESALIAVALVHEIAGWLATMPPSRSRGQQVLIGNFSRCPC